MSRPHFEAIDNLVDSITACCARLRAIATNAKPIPYDARIAVHYVSVDWPLCTRAPRPPRGSTKALIAAGWRFIGVPSYYADGDYFDYGSKQPRIRWDRRTVAIPPEGVERTARVFDQRSEALAWAKEMSNGAVQARNHEDGAGDAPA